MQFPERISFSSFVKHYLVLMDAHVSLLYYQQNGDKTPAFSRKVTLTKVATIHPCQCYGETRFSPS